MLEGARGRERGEERRGWGGKEGEGVGEGEMVTLCLCLASDVPVTGTGTRGARPEGRRSSVCCSLTASKQQSWDVNPV